METNLGSAICRRCHVKETGGIVGAHDNSTTGYDPDGLGTLGTSVGQVQCMNCHYSHRSGAMGAASPFNENVAAGKYLLSFQEDSSCFNNPNRWKPGGNTSCHGINGRGDSNKNIDIQTEVNKANSAHSAFRNGSFDGTYSNKHAATEQGLSGNGKYGTITTHVVCSDCHNPHTAGSTSHAQGTNTIATNSSLYGAGGVSLLGALGPWAVPVQGNYSVYEPLGVTTSNSWPLPKYEYEICFKCHTSFAWGGGSKPYASDLGFTMTDQLQEFNTANVAYHPVMGAMNPANYAAPAGSWVNAWSAASLMYCSDCHGNNVSVASPQGPHGSTNAGILVRAFFDQYDSSKVSPQPLNQLCAKCHNDAVYNTTPGGDATLGTGFSTPGPGSVNLHNRHKTVAGNAVSTYSYRCVNCHVRIPHGYPRRGMVVVSIDAGASGNAAIYATGGAAGAKITNFVQPAVQSYGTTTATSGCSTVAGCHQP